MSATRARYNLRQQTLMLEKLADNMTDGDFDKFKNLCESEGLGRGEIEKMKKAAVFNLLHDKGKFTFRDYSKLKTMLGDSEQGLGKPTVFIPIIEYYEARIKQDEVEPQQGGSGSGGCALPAPKKRKLEPTTQGPGPGADNTDEDEYYPRPNKKGFLVIFNNFTEERKGTERDVARLTALFRDTLHYGVKVYDNVSRKEMLKKLKAIRDSLNSELDVLDSVIIAVLSHGNKNGIKTCTRDGKTWDKKYVTQEEITGNFKGDELKRFVGKPKVFVFQACRGSKRQSAVTRPDDESGPVSSPKEDYLEIDAPKEADILIYSSSTPGTVSFRQEDTGSWCVCHLVDVLEDFHEKKDLLTMLTMVNDKVATEKKLGVFSIVKQMPCIYSTLRKKVKL